ncbi:MAG: RAD55 family ATPase [Nitrososphaerales archaeon]
MKPSGLYGSSGARNYSNLLKTISATNQDVRPEFRPESASQDQMRANVGAQRSPSSQVVSTGLDGLDAFIGGGYPDSSAILITGPPGVGKEALGYWFLRSGLKLDDFCLYVTHRPVSHVLRDMTAFGVDREQTPNWIASVGSPSLCDLNDPTNISFMIKQLVERNKGKRVRIVTDVLSPLLVLNPADTMYRYWTQLTSELRRYDAVLMAMGEDGMHSPNVVASMEQLFDGVLEMKLFENGLSFTPLLRVKKMLGVIPKAGYFRFSLTNNDLEILGNVK